MSRLRKQYRKLIEKCFGIKIEQQGLSYVEVVIMLGLLVLLFSVVIPLVQDIQSKTIHLTAQLQKVQHALNRKVNTNMLRRTSSGAMSYLIPNAEIDTKLTEIANQGAGLTGFAGCAQLNSVDTSTWAATALRSSGSCVGASYASFVSPGVVATARAATNATLPATTHYVISAYVVYESQPVGVALYANASTDIAPIPADTSSASPSTSPSISVSASMTPSATPSISVTPAPSVSASVSVSVTPSVSVSQSPAPSSTSTPSSTPPASVTPSPSNSPAPLTPSASATASISLTSSATASVSVSATSSVSVTASETPSASVSPSTPGCQTCPIALPICHNGGTECCDVALLICTVVNPITEVCCMASSTPSPSMTQTPTPSSSTGASASPSSSPSSSPTVIYDCGTLPGSADPGWYTHCCLDTRYPSENCLCSDYCTNHGIPVGPFCYCGKQMAGETRYNCACMVLD